MYYLRLFFKYLNIYISKINYFFSCYKISQFNISANYIHNLKACNNLNYLIINIMSLHLEFENNFSIEKGKMSF